MRIYFLCLFCFVLFLHHKSLIQIHVQGILTRVLSGTKPPHQPTRTQHPRIQLQDPTVSASHGGTLCPTPTLGLRTVLLAWLGATWHLLQPETWDLLSVPPRATKRMSHSRPSESADCTTQSNLPPFYPGPGGVTQNNSVCTSVGATGKHRLCNSEQPTPTSPWPPGQSRWRDLEQPSACLISDNKKVRMVWPRAMHAYSPLSPGTGCWGSLE